MVSTFLFIVQIPLCFIHNPKHYISVYPKNDFYMLHLSPFSLSFFASVEFFLVIGPNTFSDYQQVFNVCPDKFKYVEYFVRFFLEKFWGVSNPHR